VFDSVDIESDSPHVLRQCACGRRGRGFSRGWRLSGYAWRRRGRYNWPARSRLNDWRRCWSCLYALACGDRDTTSHNCGGGDAEPGPRDKVAAGDYRSSVFFCWFCTDRLGRFTC
jgi:hypothetical protein